VFRVYPESSARSTLYDTCIIRIIKIHSGLIRDAKRIITLIRCKIKERATTFYVTHVESVLFFFQYTSVSGFSDVWRYSQARNIRSRGKKRNYLKRSNRDMRNPLFSFGPTASFVLKLRAKKCKPYPANSYLFLFSRHASRIITLQKREGWKYQYLQRRKQRDEIESFRDSTTTSHNINKTKVRKK